MKTFDNVLRGGSTLKYIGTSSKLLWAHFSKYLQQTIYLLKANKVKILKKYILGGSHALPRATINLKWQHAVT